MILKKSQVIYKIIFILIFIIAIFITKHFNKKYSYDKHMTAMPDYVRLEGMYSATKIIYENNGLEIGSADDLQKTAYYPYVENISRSCLDGKLLFNIFLSKTEIRCIGSSIDSNNLKRAGINRTIPKSPSGSSTERLVNTYTSGTANIIRDVISVRNIIIDAHHFAKNTTSGCPYSFNEKPLVQLMLHGELPTEKVELEKYVDWIKRVQGLSRLNDEWGQQLTFSIAKGHFICSSKGKDGIGGTSDDISKSVPLK